MTDMRAFRSAVLVSATVALCAQATGASAQFFWSPPNLATAPFTGAEPESGLAMPDATPAELRAGLVWHLRAALNVAALQCDFAPTLLTVSNYNAMLAHHKAELASAFDGVSGYFKRTRGATWQKQLDQYGTRIYSGYSTVQAQRNFCQTAGSVGRDAIFADRGKLYDVASRRLGEIRKSLVMSGEQYFTNPAYNYHATLPVLSKQCWKKNKLSDACKSAWEQSATAQIQ
ncbi:MAG: hypothetical protein ABI395_11430 [Sphingobium sp.]